RHHTSVNRPLRRRSAPSGIAIYIIGRRYSPQVFAVIRKTVVKRQAKKFVSLCRLYRIVEVTGVSVMLAAKIEPGMRILMGKYGIVAGNVIDPLIADLRPAPGSPRIHRYWIGRRANRKEIDHHQFTVVLPARVQEPRIRLPAHG